MLVNWNLFLQSFSTPLLDHFFLALSYLGHELVLLTVIAVIYFCIDKEKGAWLAIGLLSGFALNSGIKNYFKMPRPFTYTPTLRRIDLAMSPGYSFPSAHAQTSASLATGTTKQYRKSGFIFCVLSFLIGVSRIYLGVHTPIDVAGGFLLGVLWMLCSLRLSQQASKHGKLFFLLYLVPCYLFYFLYRDEALLKVTAVFTAFLIGYLLEDRYLHYQASLRFHDAWKLLLFFAGCAIIKIPFRIFLPHTVLYIYSSYFLIGFWTSFVCPWVFLRIHRKKAQLI